MLVLGAGSGIAQACARQWAARGDSLLLVGRNLAILQTIADDLLVRGAPSVDVVDLDLVAEAPRASDHLRNLESRFGAVDIALIAFGSLPDSEACFQDPALLAQTLNTNGQATVLWMAAIGQLKGLSRLAVIGSVAGDRGRASNAAYGAAKSMVASFASAMSQRAFQKGLAYSVCLVKPGFVDTPMTRHLKKGLLWAQPEQLARRLIPAIDRGQAEVYAPIFWRGIMLVIQHLPRAIFWRLPL